MSKTAITLFSIALLSISGLVQADAHGDLQAQIEKLQQEKKVLSTRLSNAIAFSKDRASQINSLQDQLDAEMAKRKGLSDRLRNAIAFSKERAAQLEASNKSKMAMSTGLSNAITNGNEKRMRIAELEKQVDSEKAKRAALNNRLRNAIAFSKERASQIETLEPELAAEKSKRKALSNRLRNAIAFSKERASQIETLEPELAAEKSKRKALSSRLRNAIAFSKERGSEIESLQQAVAVQQAQTNWATNVGSSIDSAVGGLQGTSIYTNTDNSVTIQLGNNGLFNTGGTALSADGNQLVSLIAQELAATSASITVVGHTDNVPVGSNSRFANNEALSFARAVATMQSLRSQGIDAQRLSAAGYGADRPVASNDTPEGRQRNRRVDIVLRRQ